MYTSNMGSSLAAPAWLLVICLLVACTETPRPSVSPQEEEEEEHEIDAELAPSQAAEATAIHLVTILSTASRLVPIRW